MISMNENTREMLKELVVIIKDRRTYPLRKKLRREMTKAIGMQEKTPTNPKNKSIGMIVNIRKPDCVKNATQIEYFFYK